MLKSKTLWVLVGWSLLMLFNHYYVPAFILSFDLLVLWLTLIIISTWQIINLFLERKTISKLRLQKVFLFSVLFVLTFWGSADKVIERADWSIFFKKRQEIVEQIKANQLKPNVSWNGVYCQLPFSFPIISNGGNGILIEYRPKGSVTVTFFIFCNYFEAPSTQFVYTNDAGDMKLIDEKIKKDPSKNWRIKTFWYRTEGEL